MALYSMELISLKKDSLIFFEVLKNRGLKQEIEQKIIFHVCE